MTILSVIIFGVQRSELSSLQFFFAVAIVFCFQTIFLTAKDFR